MSETKTISSKKAEKELVDLLKIAGNLNTPKTRKTKIKK